MQQGAVAARAALADAGIGWNDVQFAFGGSDAAGNADALVADLGLTGIEFVNVSNGCATGGSALAMADRAIRSGAYDVGDGDRLRQAPAGRVQRRLPAQYGLGDWYGETGMMLTTQFFAMKMQRYLHEHDIDPAVLVDDRRQGVPQRCAQPERVAAHADVGRGDRRRRRWSADPLTKYMFCSPAEGAVALVLCRGDLAHRFTEPPGVAALVRDALSSVTARSRCSARRWRPSAPTGPTVDGGPRRVRAGRHRAGRRRRRPDPGHRVGCRADAHGRDRVCAPTASRSELILTGQTEIGGRLPINTDGGCLANGEPIGASGLRQVHENVLQLRGAAGERQVPGDPQVAFTHVYGAPGISACTVLSTVT